MRDDERNKVGMIPKGPDCMRLMRAYKQGKNQTFTKGVNGFNYFYVIVIHWEGYNDELQESGIVMRWWVMKFMISILNYDEKSPDENIQVFEWDDEVEQEEGTLPHDMKKDLCSLYERLPLWDNK